MTAARGSTIDSARQGKDLASLFHRVARRNQSARTLGGFNDDDAETETGDDAIALRKSTRKRRRARRIFADQRAVGRNLVSKLLVLRRIDVEHAAA